jgi:predicted nucleic acid-binding protein
VALVCDTGPLLAALDRDDPDHGPCAELIRDTVEDLVVPTLVLGELDYWCAKVGLHAAWLGFLEDVEAGAWRLEHPTPADVPRIREVQRQYADLRLGVVDASVLVLLERLSEPKLATLDHRHFSVVRPRHVSALTIVP